MSRFEAGIVALVIALVVLGTHNIIKDSDGSIGHRIAAKSSDQHKYDMDCFKLRTRHMMMWRCENKEVVCFSNKKGLQCKFKQQPTDSNN